jgi:CHAT domain-containing protein
VHTSRLVDDYVAAGRLDAVEALFKAAIAEVDKPSTYLKDYQPPVWPSLGRTTIAIHTITFSVYPELINLLAEQGKKEEALEYADRMRAKMLRAIIERNALGQRHFAAFSSMSAAHMRTLAKETQSTFVFYSLLPMPPWRYSSKVVTKKQFVLFAWVIQPTGSIAFETLPIDSILIDGDKEDSDPIGFAANTFSRSLKRGVIDVLKAQIEQRSGDAGERASVLRKLHDVLISRLETYLPTNPEDKVVIVPDGSLYLIPFAALLNASGQSLIERHTISIVPSLAIYRILRERTKRKIVWNSVKSVLVVGNPKMPPMDRIGDFKGALPALEGADREADEIASLFRTKAIKGDHALEDQVVARMPTANLIHFATHGLLTSSAFVTFRNHSVSMTNDLPPGAIVLADNPKKRIKIGEDDYTKMPVNGFLSSGKILKMKLDAELVTLSACDTARGRTVDHDFAALPSALMAAGARSVVMTLWSIPDAPTAEMMPVFYKELLAGRSKAAALRYAMLATKQKHPDLESWGAFTLIGSPD